MNNKKCIGLLVATWTIVVTVCLPTMCSWPPLVFRPDLGYCLPAFGEAALFPIAYVSFGLITPLCLVLGVNMRITSIAQHHRVRN